MPDIQIKRINILRGLNTWAHQPVIEAHIDLGPYEERPTDLIPGFTDRLLEAIPTLWEHRCSEGRRGGLVARMREGTWMGHVVEHVALELQGLAGMDVSYGKTRTEGDDFPGQYRVVLEYLQADAGKRSVEVAVEGCETIANGQRYDFASAIEEIRQLGERGLPNATTRAIIDEARDRGIPWIWLEEERVLQLGYGKRQKRIKENQVRKPAEAVVDSLFPSGEDGRIPIIAITGGRSTLMVAHMVDHITRKAGYHVGLAATNGLYYAGMRTQEGEYTGYWGANEVLTNAKVEVAVLETAVGDMLLNGLAFDVSDVGVVLALPDDYANFNGVHSVEDLAWATGTVVDSVRRSGYAVLNADDPPVARMARRSAGDVIYFSMHADNPSLSRHRKGGGMGVTLDGDWLVLREGRKQTRLLEMGDMPAGSVRIEDALAAAAIAWGAGIAPRIIGEALGALG